MDHYYHHYQSHNQWRQPPPPPPPPQQPNLCTVCSTPHFPFCPPYPPCHHQNPNYPPQPPYYARPGYDPYQPPLPPTPPPPPPPTVPNHHHPPYTSDPRSWHQNQNPSYSYDYATAGSGGDVDRSYKRPRIEELPGPGLTFSEDERRLKLIHDHGSATFSGLNQENRYFQNNINKVDASSIPPRSSEMYNIEDSVNNYNNNNNCVNNNYSFNHQHQIQPKDLRPAAVNNWQGYELRIGNYMQQAGGNNFSQQPPLPASPPPPLPAEPPVQQHPSSEFNAYSSSPNSPFSLFPVPVSSSTSAHSTYPVVPQPCYQKKPTLHAVGGFTGEDRQVIHRTPSVPYVGIPPKQLSSNKPKLLDASELFKMPNRASRPDHIVIILRGLPGSGKSYLAKTLRDLEVENGGEAPRIHSMDDYFMTEVEKDEETDSISVTSVRSKKTMKKKVMEYCYEPEMVEAYRESMLKAFKRTLEDGIFSFVIVDDRNLRVADFAQFWAIGKRSGYEVYVVEATYKDPVGCAARNIHGFTLDDIQQMAGQWEEAPSLYLQLDVKSLFHGDDLKESGIEEVDMEDGDHEEGLSGGQLEQRPEKMKLSDDIDHLPEDSSNNEKRWDAEGDHPSEVKDLSLSKWSNDLDEDKIEGSEAIKGNLNALSGLIQAYGKKGKSVHWSDQGSDTGFSIGAAKKAKMLSLVIGPGAGYNLKSNPLPKEESHSSNSHGSLKKQTSFQERLRAERESFKAVFDRRKRIGGLDLDEE